jgi:rare lipoprotein A
MRFILWISFVLILLAFVARADLAAAQDFDDRWSPIPKAHAEPAPGRDTPGAPAAQAPATPDTEDHSVKQSFSGEASFYSYQAGKTASGATFDRNTPTAAHRTLPFGTKVRVTDLRSEKSVIVIINDRGPYKRGRVLDLSRAAAVALGITDQGVVKVRAEVL